MNMLEDHDLRDAAADLHRSLTFTPVPELRLPRRGWTASTPLWSAVAVATVVAVGLAGLFALRQDDAEPTASVSPVPTAPPVLTRDESPVVPDTITFIDNGATGIPDVQFCSADDGCAKFEGVVNPGGVSSMVAWGPASPRLIAGTPADGQVEVTVGDQVIAHEEIISAGGKTVAANIPVSTEQVWIRIVSGPQSGMGIAVDPEQTQGYLSGYRFTPISVAGRVIPVSVSDQQRTGECAISPALDTSRSADQASLLPGYDSGATIRCGLIREGWTVTITSEGTDVAAVGYSSDATRDGWRAWAAAAASSSIVTIRDASGRVISVQR